MTDISKLEIQVDSDQAKRARTELDKLTASGRQAERAADSLASTASGALRRALGGLSAGLVAREVLQTADAYQALRGRLSLVTKDEEERTRVLGKLFDLSQRTRAQLGGTAELYIKVSGATDKLGLSEDRRLQVTEAVNRALQISNASQSAAAAATLQFSQALSSGVLRGEEFNSIIEAAPRLAFALADGLRVGRGELRALANEGRLTSEVVLPALLSQLGKLRAEAESMPTTLGQASTQLGNSFSLLIGRADTATGLTSSLARSLGDVASGLDRIRSKEDVLSMLARVATFSPAAMFANAIGDQYGARDTQVQALTREAQRLRNQMIGPENVLQREPGNTAAVRELETLRRKLAEVEQQSRDAMQVLVATLNAGKPSAGGGRGFVSPDAVMPSPAIPGKPGKPRKGDPFTSLSYDESISQSVGQLIEDSDVIRAKRYADQLTTLDKLYFDAGLSADLYDSAIKKLTGSTSTASDALSGFLDEQRQLAALLAATASEQLERQRQDMLLLTRAFEAGQISEAKYLEAVSSRLQLTASNVVKEARSAAQELGLAFTSELENALVSGNGRGLGAALLNDTLRIAIRKSVTEPITGEITKLIESATGKGGLLDGLLGASGVSAAESARISTVTALTSAELALTGAATSAAAALAAISGSSLFAGGLGGSGFGTGSLFGNLDFGGFFASGGRLGAGKWGIAGEGGRPEIIHGPARITPMQYAPTKAAPVTVNVINNAGAQVTTKERRDGNGRPVLDVLVERVRDQLGGEIDNGGGLLDPISRRTGINKSAGLVL